MSGGPYEYVVAKFGGAVTPVTVDRFTARADGSGVLLDWHATSEFQNLGFNVFRRGLGQQDWSKVNTGLLPGRITNADAKTYHLYDWPAANGAYEYKLETVDIHGAKEIVVQQAGTVTSGGGATVSPEGLAAATAGLARELPQACGK